MGDKATASPGSAKASRARGGDASKRKEPAPAAKRGGRARAKQESESEEEEEEEEEEEGEEADEEEEEAEEEEEEASETGSDSEQEREAPQTRKKLTTRKPSPRTAAARKTKDDAKRKGGAPPPPAVKSEKPSTASSSSASANAASGAAAGRRRGSAPPAKDVHESDGSETTSQGATDDEMVGRAAKGGAADKAAASESANASASAVGVSAAKDAGGAGRDRERGRDLVLDHERERERGRDSDRMRSDRDRDHRDPRDRDQERTRERDVAVSDRYPRDRDVDRDVDREHNSSLTLPSLSRAAMMHMNRGRGGADDDVPMNGYGAEPSGRSTGWRRDRSRSRSRERDSSRWNDSNQSKDNGRGDEAPNYSGGAGGSAGGAGGGPRDDDPMSPGHDGQDVRIMFHGREVYADDLIGLRVAKTFVGHGRFLGQVVKFDEPTSLYTIVYADGDAEELSIENTIQILIQDEIERADPSVPPVSAAFRNDRIPDSPEGGSVTPASSTATVSVPVAPMSAVPVPPPSQAPQQQQQQAPPSQQQQQPPVYQSRRSAVPFTEREAQFVMGMFENNALPVLLRQGWRVQSNVAGTEQRFLAPPGSFRGAGHVFLSAFDVVELIVFDNELLSACFPQNMHSVILSLFPEPSSTAASRKRGSPAVPTDSAVDSYDSKRVRGERAIGYGAAAANVAPMGRGPSVGLPPGRNDDRVVPPVAYRDRDRDRMERGDRDGGYGASASDRFAPPPPGAQGRAEPSDGYRRASGGDYRGMPLRPMASMDAPGSAPGPSSRWAGGVSGDAGEYHPRRAYGDGAPEWHDRDPMAGRGGPPAPSSSGYMGGGRPSSGGNHRAGDEPSRGGGVYYNGERGLPRGGAGAGGPPLGRPGASDPASSYGRYRDPRGPQPPSSSSGGGQYSPGPDSFTSGRYPPSGRGDGMGPPDYRGPSPAGGPPSSQQGGMGDRFARPLSRGNGAAPPGARGFSMMDVDRNVSGPGYDHHRMERGRSPHLGPDGGGGGGAGPGPGGSYMQQQQHYGHHARAGGANGVNPAEDARPL